MTDSGKSAEARILLDKLLPAFRSSLSNSSLNLFLSQRMKLANTFDEFLDFAPRVPQAIRRDYEFPDPQESAGALTPLFDSDAIKTLNSALPLKYLQQAAVSRLPHALRKQIIRATWVRSVLVSDDAMAAKLSGELEKAFPELKADLKLWREAADDETKKFAAALLMMHFPGTNPFLQKGYSRRDKLGGIDSYRENWWCGFDAGDLDEPTGNRYFGAGYEAEKKTTPPAGSPLFLNDSDKAEFMTEWKKLAAVPTAPDYFGKIVIPYVKKHPNDSRAAEALHLVVKSTRFGCTDSASGKYSREAFQLLHSKYANTEWAKKTPYWFR
jgi:hypothetical protein